LTELQLLQSEENLYQVSGFGKFGFFRKRDGVCVIDIPTGNQIKIIQQQI
jgi:hypothetical protein